MTAKRCLVAGRVQGVYYRASTQQRARELGVIGYAKNLADGRVEVLAVGEADSVATLIQWLWQGPPASHVLAVDATDVSPTELAQLGELPGGFETR